MIPISYNVRSLLVRKTTSLATVIGIALVVLVLASAMMLVNGINMSFAAGGRADNAIVLKKGAPFEMTSWVDDATVSMITVQPQVKKDGNTPVATAELVQAVRAERVGGKGYTNITIRGMGEAGMSFRPNMKIVAGNKPKPNTDEVIIGKRLRGRFKGLDVGGSLELSKNRVVKVVGVFEDNGSAFESEIWGDLHVVAKVFNLDGVVSSVRVRLESPTAFEGFQSTIEHDKRLGYQVMRETVFVENQSEGTGKLLGILGTVVSVLFAVGAMIGAMITMYGSVANRQREIGTLRALGFPRSNILISFLAESVLLTLIGGFVGTLASLAMGAVSFSMDSGNFSSFVFSFQPSAKIIGLALVAAGGMGLLGGFFPALRAARISPITAMRGA